MVRRNKSILRQHATMDNSRPRPSPHFWGKWFTVWLVPLPTTPWRSLAAYVGRKLAQWLHLAAGTIRIFIVACDVEFLNITEKTPLQIRKFCLYITSANLLILTKLFEIKYYWPQSDDELNF